MFYPVPQPFLDPTSLIPLKYIQALVHAFIFDRLYKGIPLLLGLPAFHIQRLQRVHNVAGW